MGESLGSSAPKFWYENPFVLGHYNGLGWHKNCIARLMTNFKVYDEFMNSIRCNGGFDWACECCYGSVFDLHLMNAKHFIYIGGQGSGNLIFWKDLQIYEVREVYISMPDQFFFGNWEESYRVVVFE